MEKVLLNKSYVIRVWLTAILIAPIIMLLVLALKPNVEWNAGFNSFYILTVFAEVICSLPTIFLHQLAFNELAINFKSQLLFKVVLVSIALLCLGFTLLILKLAADINLDNEVAVPVICFIVSVGICHFIFNTKITKAMPIT
jgi:hypothetical protein